MSERQSFTVTSVEDAKQALDYFNGFHDGWIKQMIMTSCDEPVEDGHQCTGLFHIVMDVVHNNYPPGRPPLHPQDQVIHLEFRNAQDIFCDFSAAYLGNTIIGLAVHPANRIVGANSTAEPCLALFLARHYYDRAHRRFELRESQVFTFAEATFREAPTP